MDLQGAGPSFAPVVDSPRSVKISPGSRLGPYEISARISAGGMGEVWRARDTRLERSVAIKVLPIELAQDPQQRLPTVPIAMSPDGRELLARTDRKETSGDVDLVSLDGRVEPLVRSESDELPESFSPNGEWIAYHSDESGRSEVYVRRRSGTGRFQISTEGGVHARWVDPGEILYANGSKLMSVRVQTSPSFSVSTPVLLFERNFADFDVARDGQILLVETPESSALAGQMNVVVNWFGEIRRKLQQPLAEWKLISAVVRGNDRKAVQAVPAAFFLE